MGTFKDASLGPTCVNGDCFELNSLLVFGNQESVADPETKGAFNGEGDLTVDHCLTEHLPIHPLVDIDG